MKELSPSDSVSALQKLKERRDEARRREDREREDRMKERMEEREVRMNDRLMEQQECHHKNKQFTNAGNWRINSCHGRTVIILHPTSKYSKTA